jgi:hypothetical protein
MLSYADGPSSSGGSVTRSPAPKPSGDPEWADEAVKAKIGLVAQLRAELADARSEAQELDEPALTPEAEAAGLRLADLLIPMVIWMPSAQIHASATGTGSAILVVDERSTRRRLTIEIASEAIEARATRIGAGERSESMGLRLEPSDLSQHMRWLRGA